MNYTVAELPKDKAFLHFECVRTGHEEYQVDYELVLPLEEADCRGTFDHKGVNRPKSHRITWLDKENRKRLPLGRTNVGCSSPNYPFSRFDTNDIELPFRDGAHCQWDGERLGNPELYYTVNGKSYKLRPRQTEKGGAE